MNKYLFTKEEATQFGWEGLTGWSYSAKEDFPNASAAYFEITDLRASAKSNISDRVYYILEGTGIFNIDGNPIPVKPTDVVIIPKGTQYGYEPAEGQILKMFIVYSPAFEEETPSENEQPPAVDLKDQNSTSNENILYTNAQPVV